MKIKLTKINHKRCWSQITKVAAYSFEWLEKSVAVFLADLLKKWAEI
jgi:hypothetical protein